LGLFVLHSIGARSLDLQRSDRRARTTTRPGSLVGASIKSGLPIREKHFAIQCADLQWLAKLTRCCCSITYERFGVRQWNASDKMYDRMRAAIRAHEPLLPFNCF
jgi:hypothetical protein